MIFPLGSKNLEKFPPPAIPTPPKIKQITVGSD